MKYRTADPSVRLHYVDLNGGDLGRAAHILDASLHDIDAEMTAGAKALALTCSKDPKHAFVFPVEVATPFEKELAGLVRKVKLPAGVKLYRCGENGQFTFTVYGASGGMANASLFYLMREPQAGMV